LKILFYSPTHGGAGGMESFVINLASFLQAKNHSVFIIFKIVKGKELKKTLEDQLKSHQLPYRIVYRPSLVLIKHIKEADIVHIQNTSIEGVILSKLLKKKCVMTIHNWRQIKWHPRNFGWDIVHKLADSRWYNSDFVRKSWETSGSNEAYDKLPILSNLPQGFTGYDLRSGFIFLGRWIENKGLEELIEAYCQADIDKSVWPLLILGDGPLRDKIHQKIKNSDSRGIQVIGFVKESKKHMLLKSAKWLVAPPKTNEDLGLTPIEARNVRVPCIITRDGGLPEAGGRYALICEPGDVIGLKKLLEKAARMEETEYQTICEQTKIELDEYLKPMSLYETAYQKVINNSR
jgi:glycosyltransferase involved in cell wall biosynthesis